MPIRHTPRVLLAAIVTLCWSCGGGQSSAPPSPAPASQPPAAASAGKGTDDANPADERPAPPARRTAAALAALMPSDATGCAPGARCLKVDPSGRPLATGSAIAQCRGEFADFIVPKTAIPAGYAGPWFQPEPIEQAHTGIPQGTRPWRHFDPRQDAERLAYAIALRNYAFASAPVRSLTPTLTSDADYLDPVGGTVPDPLRAQKWYPAPRMIYTTPGNAREPAQGMTLERTIPKGELGNNTTPFRNYAVAFYDARGARTYARVWSTQTAGVDAADVTQMTITAGGMVYKLLFSAAKPTDFPVDLLEGSLTLTILPGASGTPVAVRLLQIDIAAKDDRAGATGWYFATYAFDRSISGTSPWLKMAPVGLMWGNDPAGPPLKESWINPAAPQYAKDHLGVDSRLNGPVDNKVSACMSCHGTAQARSLANMLPPLATSPCASERPKWFRNLPGSEAFGRLDDSNGTTCQTALNGETLTAADYSLQLASTVTRSMAPATPTFNPCTWDAAHPPPLTAALGAKPSSSARVFEVTRDPAPSPKP